MNAQLFRTTEPNENRTSCTLNAWGHRERIEAHIGALYAMGRTGLWGVILFFMVSAVALLFRDATLSGIIPGGVRALLGDAPPVFLIDILVGVSTLSTVILNLSHFADGRKPLSTWNQVVILLLLYGLYFIADSLADRILMVFAAGVATLGLHQVSLWFYTKRQIEEDQELLSAIPSRRESFSEK